jgi:hypothetical protein
MEPSTTKVQISGDSGAPLQVKSIAQLMSAVGDEEKGQEKVMRQVKKGKRIEN